MVRLQLANTIVMKQAEVFVSQSKYFIPLWIVMFSLQAFLCGCLIGYIYIYYLIYYVPWITSSFIYPYDDEEWLNKLRNFLWPFVLLPGRLVNALSLSLSHYNLIF